MQITKLWAVYDPSKLSVEEDIVSGCTPLSLAHLVLGMCSLPGGKAQVATMSLYTEEAEAREDARERLRVRDVALKSGITLS